MSQGFGITKQPLSCKRRKAARCVPHASGMAAPPGIELAAMISPDGVPVNRPSACSDGPQKRALLAQYEALRLRGPEVRGARRVGPQPRTVLLICGDALERDQRQRDVVGPFVGHEVAEEVAAAGRDDGGVSLERVALVRIEDVADAAGHGHKGASGPGTTVRLV